MALRLSRVVVMHVFHISQINDGYMMTKGVTTPTMSALPILRGLTSLPGHPEFRVGDLVLLVPLVFNIGDPATPGVCSTLNLYSHSVSGWYGCQPTGRGSNPYRRLNKDYRPKKRPNKTKRNTAIYDSCVLNNSPEWTVTAASPSRSG